MNKKPSYLTILALSIIFTSCSSNQLEGKWQYDGGIYNGKPKAAAPDFVLQRTYTNDKYEAHTVEAGVQGEKYAGGDYKIDGDSLLLTGTFSSQVSQLVGITQRYEFKLEGGKLTTKGILPNGMNVEEYWKKVD
ncbi:MAG TPA: hypothetical protein VNI52_07985 [Sphingobacteriaceae bacterium]|nr:hypothetical protein [Sphingobacteriaceae bacterium]